MNNRQKIRNAYLLFYDKVEKYEDFKEKKKEDFVEENSKEVDFLEDEDSEKLYQIYLGNFKKYLFD